MKLRMRFMWVTTLLLATATQAAEYVRWTGSEDQDGSLEHVLSVLSTKLGAPFKREQFRLNEQRTLAYSKFEHYPQVHAGVDVEGTSLRIWTDRTTGKLIQVEAHVEKPAVVQTNSELFANKAENQFGFAADDITPLSNSDALRIAVASIRHHEDHKTRRQHVHLVWSGPNQIAIVRLTAARGTHEIWIDSLTRNIIKSNYNPHATQDLDQDVAPLSANLYPIYEEFEGTMLPRQKINLRFLLPTVRYSTVDPFSPLRDRQYLAKKI